MAKDKPEKSRTPSIRNRKAAKQYEVIDRVEAGLRQRWPQGAPDKVRELIDVHRAGALETVTIVTRTMIEDCVDMALLTGLRGAELALGAQRRWGNLPGYGFDHRLRGHGRVLCR